MKNMRIENRNSRHGGQARIVTSFVAAIAFAFAGCATIQPGNDPAVVAAEVTLQSGIDTFDAFLKWESVNRASLLASSPSIAAAVHTEAEYLRAKDPVTHRARAQQWLITGSTLIEAYKSNRTTQNKANFQTVMATISAALNQISVYYHP
jgi:hypothetical protein